MSIENSEKGKMRIVHIKESGPRLRQKDLDFSKPESITPEFLERLELYNPMRQIEKVKLFNIYKNETDPEIKKVYWDTLIDFILETEE